MKHSRRKKIRFFHQHISEKVENYETCGIACALMILDLYKKESLTTKKEFELYKAYRSKVYKMGTLGSALAFCLSGYGLQVCLMHSSPNLLDNKESYFEPELFRNMLEEWKGYIVKCRELKKPVEVLSGVPITCNTIKEQIESGRQVILMCLIDGNVDGIHEKSLHWIVVYGYEENTFLVCNPAKSKQKFSEEELCEYMDTPLGQICITVEEGNFSECYLGDWPCSW